MDLSQQKTIFKRSNLLNIHKPPGWCLGTLWSKTHPKSSKIHNGPSPTEWVQASLYMRCCKVHLFGTDNMRPLQFCSPSIAHIYMRFLWNILHLYGWWQLFRPLFWRDLDGFEIIPTSKYRSLAQPSGRFGEVSPIPASWLSSLSIARCLACQAKTQQDMPLGGGTWGQYNTKDL